MILAFVGMKGGQGRTTLAVRLGAWLARAGHRTVVVDLAETGSASTLLGFGGVTPGPGSGELMAGLANARTVVRETDHERLFAVPADAALSDVQRLPVPDRAVRALTSIAQDADFVILDAPPGGGPAALAAQAAARWCLVPVVPDHLGLAGLDSTMSWLRSLRPNRQRAARLAGVVLNQTESASATACACEDTLRGIHPRDVFRASIRKDQAFRVPSTLARVFRDRPARGADLDVKAWRSELLKLLVRRS